MEDPYANSLADARTHFEQLATHFHEHGIDVVVILSGADPLKREAGFTWFSKGNPVTAAGMLVQAGKELILGP